MELLDFSDEILILICGFLRSVDVLALSETCERMNSLLCEARFARRVHLKAAYQLNDTSLKMFFSPTLRCERIDTLNLTSCFWLSSESINNAVLELRNLRCLYVQDTNLTFEHLFWILKKSKNITHLSWTFNSYERVFMTVESEAKGCLQMENLLDGIHNKLLSLEYLNLEVTCEVMNTLSSFLLHCHNLQELRLKCKDTNSADVIIDSITEHAFKFFNLHSLVIQLHGFSHHWSPLIFQLLHACNTVSWKMLWFECAIAFPVLESLKQIQAFSGVLTIHDFKKVLRSEHLKYLDCRYFNGNALSQEINSVEQDLYNSSITHMSWRLGPLTHYLPRNLKHLYVLSDCCEFDRKPSARANFCQMKNLLHLSVPFCAFIRKFQKNDLSTNRRTFNETSSNIQKTHTDNSTSPTNSFLIEQVKCLKVCSSQHPYRCSPNNMSKPIFQDTRTRNTTAREKSMNDDKSFLISKKKHCEASSQDYQDFYEEPHKSDNLCYRCTFKLSETLELQLHAFPSHDIQLPMAKQMLQTLLKQETHLQHEIELDNDDDKTNKNNSIFYPSTVYRKEKVTDKVKNHNIWIHNMSTMTQNSNDILVEYNLATNASAMYACADKKSICKNPSNKNYASAESKYYEDKSELSFLHKQTPTKITPIPSLLGQFALLAPNLKELEIKKCKSRCNQHATLEDLRSLQCITFWTKLESLFLEELPITETSFLIQIGICCPKIQRLGFKFVGDDTKHCITEDLTEMLTRLTHLQDFRLESEISDPLNGLLVTLSNHEKLQRIAILNAPGQAPLLDNCYLVLENCRNMIFMYLYIKSFTEEMIRDFQAQVLSRFVPYHHSLWACIDGKERTSLEKIPARHREEMLINPAQLKIMPPLEE